MIQIESLSKTYGTRSRTVTAIRDVSLTIAPGVWGVVGPNGAGKTTLLGLVMGFLHPTEGTITIEGSPPRRYLRRTGAAYLPERFQLPEAWPVRAALHSLARLEGHPGGAAPARVETALERTGLEEHAHRPIGALSRGLNQRVGLAQALLSERRLVVLDEPTEGLDPLWRIRFRDLVAELRGQDRTVLLASHELHEVERLADRVIVLDDGRVTEVMDARQPHGGPHRYRLWVTAGEELVRAAFPTAQVRESASGTRDAGDAAEFLVRVADDTDLSHRLAALLDAGAILHAVTPSTDDLETRVRQRLEEP